MARSSKMSSNASMSRNGLRPSNKSAKIQTPMAGTRIKSGRGKR